MMQVKYILILFYLWFSNIMLFAQDTTITNKQYLNKNAAGLELLGSSGYYSLFYERMSIKNNFSFRTGINWHTTYNKAGGSILYFGPLYSIRKLKKLSFKVGIYNTFFIVYQPNPATKEERDSVLKNPGSWGLPYEPPLQYAISPIFHINYNFKNFSIYASYDPFIIINGGIHKRTYVFHWGGIGVLKYF